jgi:hypothetical protein
MLRKMNWLVFVIIHVTFMGFWEALCLVYAFRYGKAIIIAPMTTALSLVITVVISLAIYTVIPHTLIIAGILLAITSAVLMGIEETKNNNSLMK